MLKGKVAVVTGSTSGIGRGIATALATHGADVMLNGIGDGAEIVRVAKDLEERHSVRTGYSPADVSRPAEIRQLIADAQRLLGPVDILVNNAGIQHVAPLEQFAEEHWNAILAINLSAAFHSTKAVLLEMKQRHWGRIINIASTHGLVASAGKAAYVAAKHGLVGLTKVIAIETANDGITCNAICPGWVLTPLVQQQIADRAQGGGMSIEAAQRELLQEKQPMLQFTTPQQIGALAVVLCDDATATVTGAAWPVDGGWTAQ